MTHPFFQHYISPSTLAWSWMLIALTSFIVWYQYRLRRPLQVAAIYIYPIKSCRGISMKKCDLTRLGLKYDRQWMLVSSVNNQMVTAREIPSMVMITPELDEEKGVMTVSFKEKESIQIPMFPKDTEVKKTNVIVWEEEYSALQYTSDEITEWFTSILSVDPYLSKSPNSSSSSEKVTYHLVTIVSREKHQRPLNVKHDWNVKGGNAKTAEAKSFSSIQTAFSDGYPLLLTSASSLAHLNSWSNSSSNDNPRYVPERCFRPNIVVDGGKLLSWEEDLWREIVIGSGKTSEAIKFWVSKPCERCILTTVEPETGKRHSSGEPLISLRQHRKMLRHIPKYTDAVFFGQNIIPLSEAGVVSVGDRVKVLEKKPSAFEFAPQYLENQKEGSEEERKRKEEYGM